MWSSKMAARWRKEDGRLNAGNGDFLTATTRAELVLSRDNSGDVERDIQSCEDNSILAILQDATVASESKSNVEEENETLLSSLTEMLDSVEDNDGTLSPFDSLPDNKLLTFTDPKDSSVPVSPAERLRPRPKLLNDDKEDEKIERNSFLQPFKQQSQALVHPDNKKADGEVEVFSSASLINLVKLMHSYCLKLHVEDGDKTMRNHVLISQGEVWRYERPTEENDEEINVVSDDDAPVKDSKEEKQRDQKRDNGLKSVLLNGNSLRAPPSREKKRVSFGPIQVASFDESLEKCLEEKNLANETGSVPLHSTKALENPCGSALDPQTPSSEMKRNEYEGLPPKRETKSKSLSLHEYRQLRRKRQPLVEKLGNYTTRWPSVSDPPKELPPILCLQGQKQSSGTKTTNTKIIRVCTDHLHKPPPRPQHLETKLSTHLHHSGLKRPRTKSKIDTPSSPLSDVSANGNVILLRSKKSPVKKPTFSSDPPNPVLLPLLVSQTLSPSTAPSSPESKVEFLNIGSNLQSNRHLQETKNESSATCPQRQPSSSEPKPQALLLSQDSATMPQEVKNKLSERATNTSSRSPASCPPTAQTESASECIKLQSQQFSPGPMQEIKWEPKILLSLSPHPLRQIKCPPSTPCSAQPPSTIDASLGIRVTLPEFPPSISAPEEPTPQLGPRVQSAAGESGIEAPDLTSLLEQFEETQAKEECACKNKLEPTLSAAPPSDLLTSEDLDLHRTQSVALEKTSRLLLPPSVEALKPLSTSEHPGTPDTAMNLPDLQMLEHEEIPEPIGTEIILSTQQERPTRRKNTSSKTVQIIDPRPLPPKKTHGNPSEPSVAHNSPHLLSSVSSDHDYCGSVDHSLTGASHHDRAKPSLLKDIHKATSELQVTTHDSSVASECKTQTTVGAAKSLFQCHSEQPRTRLETEPSTHRAPQVSDNGGAGDDSTPPCTLPTPPPSPPRRGREKRRYRRRSPLSDSSSRSSSPSCSSSASRSPKRRKHHHKRSESSSSSSSSSRSVSRSPPRHYRLTHSRCSRSRSRSWSPSRSRSPSPRICCRRWRDVYSRESRRLRREHEMRIQKLKAIDERRVVYVGRICRSMTHNELRERFSQFGEVECVSLHFRDRGDHYGFVTFYNIEDAFAAIDNGGKLRRPDELPFDICFGGRRQFCNSNYSDLDANRDTEPSPADSRFEDLDFDSLLQQAQRGLKR
ncbi:peroxisome proliferator-activated receptor gamma coactivator-related protein 1 isoform X2 [Mastacembelus armatus]|uniref:peroxisome proliferator-activated receptor gamma coactivator-related protein 1 isoform X2 n=1 Tax=Mastacembelus armatus TaxID=205130 RepID=UPI000E45636D|nr:peroxisome proliferator-activated receptor gamma coactivator-related protein 1-like isoform X2 [Mastacembelus armatus]